MQKERCIAAVVEDHVGKTAIWPLKNAVCEFPVFLNGFAFFGEDGDAIFHDCCSGVVLVEKMLQLAQRTSAPNAVRVSIRTAV